MNERQKKQFELDVAIHILFNVLLPIAKGEERLKKAKKLKGLLLKKMEDLNTETFSGMLQDPYVLYHTEADMVLADMIIAGAA